VSNSACTGAAQVPSSDAVRSTPSVFVSARGPVTLTLDRSGNQKVSSYLECESTCSKVREIKALKTKATHNAMSKDSRHVVDPAIVKENENISRRAYEQGDYVLCFLLSHALVESLLRAFLERAGNETFNDLIIAYDKYLKTEGQTNSEFVKELTELNRRRNRVVHQLWGKGYSVTNKKLEPACRGAFIVFGLFIEWLETFDPEITESGFDYEKEGFARVVCAPSALRRRCQSCA
jgi:hypothetical protein